MHEILGIGLVLFCIPLILPSWKWIAGCTAAFFFLSVAVYVQHRYIVAVAGTECNTVIELKSEHHAA